MNANATPLAVPKPDLSKTTTLLRSSTAGAIRESSPLFIPLSDPTVASGTQGVSGYQPTCHECTRQGAITPATFVDHRRPHGGNDAMFWDQSNWQPLCRRCSNMKTDQEIQAREKSRTRRGEEAMANTTQPKPMFTIPVTVVCGPPGAGKTTYVTEHAELGDLIIDVDGIYMALSGQPMYSRPQELLSFVLHARQAIIERLRSRSNVRKAWLITTAAKKPEREVYVRDGADVVVLATPAAECLKRIAADERRSTWDGWTDLVTEWWASYEE